MDLIEDVQVFDHHRGEIIVELIGVDEQGKTAVDSFSCDRSEEGAVRLHPKIDEPYRPVVESALQEYGIDVVSEDRCPSA